MKNQLDLAWEHSSTLINESKFLISFDLTDSFFNKDNHIFGGGHLLNNHRFYLQPSETVKDAKLDEV